MDNGDGNMLEELATRLAYWKGLSFRLRDEVEAVRKRLVELEEKSGERDDTADQGTKQ
jgi:hypothetical protein